LKTLVGEENMAVEVGEEQKKELRDRIGEFLAEQIVSTGNDALIAELWFQ
jgi:hypothetical protein